MDSITYLKGATYHSLIMRYLFPLGLLLIGTLLILGCSKDTTGASTAIEPVIKEETSATDSVIALKMITVQILGANGFDPKELTIRKGDTVIFSNEDPRKKDTVLTFQSENSQKFTNSNIIKPGQTFEKVFTNAGTYNYWTQSYAPRGKIIVG